MGEKTWVGEWRPEAMETLTHRPYMTCRLRWLRFEQDSAQVRSPGRWQEERGDHVAQCDL